MTGILPISTESLQWVLVHLCCVLGVYYGSHLALRVSRSLKTYSKPLPSHKFILTCAEIHRCKVSDSSG